MLYLNLEHLSVTKEPSQIRSEESFTPTLDINEGWETVVVDMYKTREDADEQAKLLLENAKNNNYDRKKTPLKYANGKNIPYICGFGWGSSFEKCFIKKVTVQDLDYYEYEVSYV